MHSNKIILHLHLINSIGPGTIQKIIERKPAGLPWADLYSFSAPDWQRNFNFSDILARKLIDGLSDAAQLDKELHLIEKHRINWATVISDDYPELLKHIHLPPAVLYWQGAPLNSFKQNIAIVGSRKANEYGQRVIDDFVPDLLACNWTIVSGGALGADTMAHRATVAHNGTTIAVLGSGLLVPYPYRNKKLFAEIVHAGGAIVSAFPLQTQAHPGNFPSRNRIIAGLSRGCIVVQAAAQSGARITAQFALDQGRDVFAIPGSIYDPLSAGCHGLIGQGAKAVHEINDILVEYGQKIEKIQSASEKEKTKRQPEKHAQQTIPTVSCENETQHKIVQLCVRPASFDDLVAHTGIAMQDLQQELFAMQLNGIITQDFSGLWKQSF